MPKGPDPRASPAARDEVPRLLREGAGEWNARRFWHAHESWESAWHALRAAGETSPAEFLHGLILCAAALENATRGKEDGFKRQGAEGLWLLRTHLEAGGSAILARPSAFLDAMTLLHLDGCRRRDWTAWSASGWVAPAVEVA